MAANRYFVVYDNLYIICYYPAILTYLTLICFYSFYIFTCFVRTRNKDWIKER